MSSWSCPHGLWPLAASTPTTRNGRFRTRIIWPTGSIPGKSWLATVCPMTATRAAVVTSASVKKAPEATARLRISGKLVPTPSARVVQFWLPYTRVTPAVTLGVAPATAGASRRIACTSSGVRVVVVPAPPRTPPVFWLPACTTSILVPMLAICSATWCWAPCPRLTIAITAATPITIPSIVRIDRALLRASARSAIFNTGPIIPPPLPEQALPSPPTRLSAPIPAGRSRSGRPSRSPRVPQTARCPARASPARW